MSSQYFGQYLLEKGIITPDQLLTAINHQKAVNMKLGVLAMDKKYMTSQQVEDILEIQKERDAQFGELAVENKIITTDQLTELLSIQKSERIFLGESLVEKGYLTLQQLENCLTEYKKYEGEIKSEVLSELNSINPRYSTIIKDSIEVIQKMLIRVADKQSKIISCYEGADYKTDSEYIILNEIYGDRSFTVGLSLSGSILLSLASSVFKKILETMDDYTMDCIKELHNMICAYICGALSKKGIETSTKSPDFQEYKEFSFNPESTNIIITLLMPEGCFDIYFIMD